MFEVPRTAGGHPRLVLGVLGALVLGGAVWAGVATSVAPKSDAVLVAERSDAPPRPPVVVVEDLPKLAARLDREAAAGRFMGCLLYTSPSPRDRG